MLHVVSWEVHEIYQQVSLVSWKTDGIGIDNNKVKLLIIFKGTNPA